MPSTSTRMVPSGSRNSCSTRTTVPTGYSSSCDGSATSLRFCAVTNSMRSRETAFSIALIEGSLPTKSGVVMYGNTTRSRSGSSGSRSWNSNVSSPRATVRSRTGSRSGRRAASGGAGPSFARRDAAAGGRRDFDRLCFGALTHGSLAATGLCPLGPSMKRAARRGTAARARD